ncbi:MAG: sugar phosphate isomerase/epimerase family protein [bacterium]
MKSIGFNSGIRYDWHVLDVISVFEQTGVKYVELWGAPPHADLTDQRLIRSLNEIQNRSAIDIVAVHPPARGVWNIAAKAREDREKALALLKKILDNLLQLGVEKMVLHPGEHRPAAALAAQDALKCSAESINILLDYMAGRNQQLCVENTLPHHIGGSLEELSWLDEQTGKRFSFTLDTSHASLGREKIGDYVKYFGSRLRHTHLSDNFGSHDDHLPPGDGAVDFPPLLRLISQNSFLDYWMLEVLEAPGVKRLPDLIEYSRKRFLELLSKTFSRPHGRRVSRLSE